ncbi:hypothetical protein N8E89_07175 [Phyllobacterium sp. A18/5-2]|uniref:hypothetical protein n=1 Tax=Phyllobacterium sp. A18/5-2 TaxID=2978392 RepID=UPI0021CA0DAB|nr:hypothetical protein [Phyllobacterium sp. A18/5-2]UXN65421.1 hypothetical protein N8E89_07175 [Phyllobacterium sp. A18/5-2]
MTCLPVSAQEVDRTKTVPFAISVDGEPVVKSKQDGPTRAAAKQLGQSPEPSTRKTGAGLNTVDVQVKFDGLDAKTLLNISTMPVRRAYKAGEYVNFLATSNYPAFIKRAEVRILNAEDEVTEKPFDIIPVAINREARWIMPETRDETKRFKYILRVYDDEGRFDETLARNLARSDRELPAEINTGHVVSGEGEATAPGMGEDNTARRNIPVYGGAVTVYGRNVPEGYQVKALGDTIPLDPDHAFVMQRILPPGDHDIDVAVLGLLKDSALDFTRRINIPKNDWFYVALADLTVGKRFGDNDIEAVRPGEYDDIYSKGRLAFYVKGKIKGKYLLTAAADTSEDDLDHIFRGLDAKDPRQLLRRLDPNDYYPIYGDDLDRH